MWNEIVINSQYLPIANPLSTPCNLYIQSLSAKTSSKGKNFIARTDGEDNPREVKGENVD